MPSSLGRPSRCPSQEGSGFSPKGGKRLPEPLCSPPPAAAPQPCCVRLPGTTPRLAVLPGLSTSHTPALAVCVAAEGHTAVGKEEGEGGNGRVPPEHCPEGPQDAVHSPARSHDSRARCCLPGKLVETQRPGFLLGAGHAGSSACMDQNPDSQKESRCSAQTTLFAQAT